MERLVPILNQLQSVLGVLGSHSISLPQLVVVGSQSSGKSSVLENIVGRDFLPRGNNIVTRRPLVLTLHTTALPPSSSADQTTIDPSLEWGEFDHSPGTKFHEFSAIKQEIVAETERLVGKGCGISSEPIFLHIYSPYVPSLTMVDLPGITKVPTGDQPMDIEKQIKNLVMQFVTNPNSIIVAVSSATEDISNSEAIKIARQVDPQGQRTLGVLTKIDLMDEGTDALHVLQNRSIPLKLGYTGIINRSQKDINTGKTIYDALLSEKEFFASSPIYAGITSQLGTAYLTSRLSSLLFQHIQLHLPTIKQQILQTIHETERELDSYGHPLGLDMSQQIQSSLKDSNTSNSNSQHPTIPQSHLGPILLELLSKYAASFNSSLDGKSMGPSAYDDITTSELYGGARISFVFNELFGRQIGEIDPFQILSDLEIRTAIRNATGPRATLFLPEMAFELLIKRQIERLRAPASTCIDLILDELLRVAAQCQGQAVPHLVNFPELRERLLDTVRTLVNSRVISTRQMVQNIVNIEMSYINTSHPDFIGGSRALTHLALLKKQKAQQAARQAVENGTDYGTTPEEQQQILLQEDQARFMKQIQAHKEQMAAQHGGAGKYEFHSQFGNFTTEQVQLYSEMPPSEREMVEIDVIKLLIASYFGIVKKTIKDTVPKAIMYHLVNKTKEDIQSELVRELYKESEFPTLLKEADDISEKRAACTKLIKVMRKAYEIVSRIKDLSL